MGDVTKTVAKVFYVIRSAVGWYMSDNGPKRYDASGALQFSSASRALEAYGERRADDEDNTPSSPQLIRVEVTPGSEERVVLGELQQGPAGGTVQYAIKNSAIKWGAGPYTFADSGTPSRPTTFGFTSLSLANLYHSQADAIEAIQYRGTGGGRLTIVRVAVQPSAPKYTETVLA